LGIEVERAVAYFDNFIFAGGFADRVLYHPISAFDHADGHAGTHYIHHFLCQHRMGSLHPDFFNPDFASVS
jgi:hypothetical protein